MQIINTKDDCHAISANSSVIVLPTCKGILVIPVLQIIRIQSISNYSKLFFKDGKTLVVAKVLRWFQEQTCLFSFVRIHRTHLINIDHVKNYSGSKTGLLFLHNGETFPVAKRRKAGLSERLKCLNRSLTDEATGRSLFSTKKKLAA